MNKKKKEPVLPQQVEKKEIEVPAPTPTTEEEPETPEDSGPPSF